MIESERKDEPSAQDLYEAPTLGAPAQVPVVTLFSGEVVDGGIIFGD
jgi:hypothetical protein